MIYIENTCTDPTYNLAFEEYIFSQVHFEEPVLLLWRNEPSVIVGKYQNTLEEVDEQYVRDHGIRVVRRNTGGGAVYHDLGNLNYSFIVPGVDRMKVDFQTFTRPVVKALRSYGIEAEQTGRNDIVAGDKKFSGNAQQLSKGWLLHHGTLMFDVDTDRVAAALRVKPGKFRSKATKSVRSRVTNLKPLMMETAPDSGASDMTTLDFKALLLDWFRREYDLRTVELSPDQLEQILRLQEEKYRTDAWNFGRSPKSDVTRGDFFRCGQVEFHFSVEEHKIRRVQITGDFFSAGDIGELERMLEGVPYDRESLLEVLGQTDLGYYLGDVTAGELADVIV